MGRPVIKIEEEDILKTTFLNFMKNGLPPKVYKLTGLNFDYNGTFIEMEYDIERFKNYLDYLTYSHNYAHIHKGSFKSQNQLLSITVDFTTHSGALTQSELDDLQHYGLILDAKIQDELKNKFHRFILK